LIDKKTPRDSVLSSYAQAEGAPPCEEREIYIDLAVRLEPLRDKAVEKKGPIERRMIRALQQYNGWSDSHLPETKNKPVDSRADTEQPPVIHLTRQITDQITAKVINMLLPSNERGWEIGPTPDPELMLKLKDDSPVVQMQLNQFGQQVPGQVEENEDGSPVTYKQRAEEEKQEAESRAKKMQVVMDDQMTETKFPRLGRKLIKSAFKVGTGIMHGPVMTGKTRVVRSRVEGTDENGNTVCQWDKNIAEDSGVDFQVIDPFAFYPEAVESLDICEHAFVWESMSPSRVERLKKWPGFVSEQIDVLLALKPDHGELKSSCLRRRADAEGIKPDTDKHYSMWRYFGPVPNSTLSLLGEMEADEDELSRTTLAEVWFSQGIVIKVKITPMEESTHLPFYAMCYEESDTSIFGYGVPDHVRDSQVVIDSSWHMILHNAAISSGPIVLTLAGALKPLDGDWNIDGGLKQFEVDSTEMPGDIPFSMNNAMKVIQIDARTSELMVILEKAVELAQLESNYPALAQGAPTEAVTTTSGLAMLDNAQTAPQRTIAQRWDDDVMILSLEELYDWNMLYNPDDEIKGDYKIVAHGATRLVNKDMQAQHLQVIAALSDNARFSRFSNDFALWKAILKSADVDSEQLSITDDEYQALQEAGPSPLEAAQQAEAESKARLAAAQAAKLESELDPSRGFTPEQELQLEEFRLKEIGQTRSLQEKQLELESAEMIALSKGEITLLQIRERMDARDADRDLKEALETRKIDSKELLEGIKTRMKIQRESNRERNLDRGFDSF